VSNLARKAQIRTEYATSRQNFACRGEDGKIRCKFGVLVKDDRCSNIFEALVGTLRAAKVLPHVPVGTIRSLAC
jgi:hypothetical protein